MKNTIFNMAVGAIVGVAIGAGAMHLANGDGFRRSGRLTVTLADGNQEVIKIYRGEDCDRWGAIITGIFVKDAQARCDRT